MLPQKLIRCTWNRNITVLRTFPSVDVDHHTLFIDVRDFEVQRFLEPQAAGIDCGEEGVVARRRDAGEGGAHLFGTEHSRKPVFSLRPDDAQDIPVTAQNVLKEKADAGIADSHGFGCPLEDVSAMEEVSLKLFFGDEIGGFVAEMLDEQSDCASVTYLRCIALTAQLQGFFGLLVPVFHGHTLLVQQDLTALEMYGNTEITQEISNGGGMGAVWMLCPSAAERLTRITD